MGPENKRRSFTGEWVDLGRAWRGDDDSNDGILASYGSNAPEDGPKGRISRSRVHGISDDGDNDPITTSLERLVEQSKINL